MLEGINLYPSIEEVMQDKELACVFRPVLTAKKAVKGKEFLIHALLCPGTVYDQAKGHPYSENGFYGFDYNGGKYKYLGSKDAFIWDYHKIKEVYCLLQNDFQEQKQRYLSEKISGEDYIKEIMYKVSELVKDENEDYVNWYLEGFYSYELVKYNYQSTGILKSYNEITKGWNSSKDFIYSEEDIANIVDEFFVNIEYNLSNSYDITEE